MRSPPRRAPGWPSRRKPVAASSARHAASTRAGRRRERQRVDAAIEPRHARAPDAERAEQLGRVRARRDRRQCARATTCRRGDEVSRCAPRAAPMAAPRPSRTTSNTSSSSVAAVTSGPAPGPTKHWRPPTASSRMPFVAPLTRASGWLPARNAGPTNAADRPVRPGRVRERLQRSAEARARRAGRRHRSRRAREWNRRRIDTSTVRELTKQHAQLFSGVAPLTSVDGSGSARPTALRVVQGRLEGGSLLEAADNRVRRAVEDAPSGRARATRADAARTSRGTARRQCSSLRSEAPCAGGAPARRATVRAPRSATCSRVTTGMPRSSARRTSATTASTPPSTSTTTSSGREKKTSGSDVTQSTQIGRGPHRVGRAHQGRGDRDATGQADANRSRSSSRETHERRADVAETQQANADRADAASSVWRND